MLNGTAPIMIVSFKKLLPQLQELTTGIPLIASVTNAIPLVPIPIYFDPSFGLFIQSETKNIDIETKALTLPDGSTPKAQQAGINSVIGINIQANQESVGLKILSAMADLIFEKVTSQEYSVAWLSGAVTAFGCLFESFSVQQSADNDLYQISLQLSRVTGGSTVEKAAPTTLENTSTISLKTAPT